MIENVGFGVAQTMEYGYRLETIHDGRHAVCERAVNHFKPEFDTFLDRINSNPPKGDLKEWYAKVKNAAIEAAEGMALQAEEWARNNHSYGADAVIARNEKGKAIAKRGWDNRTGDAERGLTGYTVVDGVTKAL
jgi:hypothetical protein